MKISEAAVELFEEKPKILQRIKKAKAEGGTSLDLSNLDLTPQDLALLADLLKKQLPDLKMLDLSGNSITSKSFTDGTINLKGIEILGVTERSISYKNSINETFISLVDDKKFNQQLPDNSENKNDLINKIFKNNQENDMRIPLNHYFERFLIEESQRKNQKNKAYQGQNQSPRSMRM